MAVAAASQAATHPGLTTRQPRTGIEQPTASARLVGVDAAKQSFAVGSLGWAEPGMGVGHVARGLGFWAPLVLSHGPEDLGQDPG